MNCEVLSFEAVHVCGIFLVRFIYVSIDNLNQDHGVPCVKDRVVDVSFSPMELRLQDLRKAFFFPIVWMKHESSIESLQRLNWLNPLKHNHSLLSDLVISH